MPLAKRVLKHMRHALGGAPAVLRALVTNTPADSPNWDRRPNPERFSAREVLAHLADWDVIFRQRIELILSQDTPEIPEIDEERLPADHGYSTQDPYEALDRFCAARERLIRTVSELPEEDWARAGRRGDMGEMTVADQVVMVGIHDGYHLRQMAEYLGGVNSQT